ncbi:hypothetical protein [Kaistia defluvii]|uniref:Uncharacterized protein n=1 Tax=Kaistia defluvii TaxID=410841 RepID=A0ABV2R0W6_9HYPH
MIWDRERLYLEVWQSPMIELAARLEVSGTNLKKICVNADIPVPPQGYWNKLAAGKPVPTRPPLGPSRRGIERAQYPGPRPQEENLLTQADRDEVTASVSSVAVPKSLKSPHPLIARLLDNVGFRLKHVGMISNGAMREALQIAELTATDERRLRILDTLFKELAPRGWQIKLEKSRQFSAVHEEGRIYFKLNERIRRESIARRPPTNAFEELIWRPTTQIFHRSKWEDSERAGVEARLPDILGSFLLWARLWKHEKPQRQLRAAQMAEAESVRKEQMAEAARVREAAQTEQRQERERWASLLGASEAWRDAAVARAFVEELAARIGSSNEHIDGKPTSDWLEWARRRIAETDPLARGAMAALCRIVGKS